MPASDFPAEPDLVIIGAGSAGAVIAARATEDPARTVLLLEAGPDYPDTSVTPYDLVNSHQNSLTDHDWGFDYKPTAQHRGATFPRGRVTGGSSAVNTTIALRGMPEDYDYWASMGNPAWAWEKILPAFNRMERDLDYGDKPYHGDAGPISIRRYTWDELTPVHQAWWEAARSLGYPDCLDANDPDSWGAGPHPMNKLGRLRISTAIGYLSAARARPNLRIQANSPIRRFVVENGRVVAAEVERNGAVELVRGKHFVLSAGSIQSPSILLRSGIGPADEVARHGIELVKDVPAIGNNLCDHPALSVACTLKDASLIDLDHPIVQTILRYTAPGSDQRNDLQIEQFSFSPRGDGRPAMAIAAVLEQSYSTGTLRLSSADPGAKPLIEQRFLEDERDLSRLVQCFKDTLAFIDTEPMASLIDDVIFPSRERELNDESIAGLLKRFAASGYHPCGTVKMGPSSDPLAAVDQYGRFHGLDGLSVADASIMPTVPRANTNLTSIMIGEVIGEQIRRNGV